MVFETERLRLREMDRRDFRDLCEILQDKEVMYAYKHAFSDREVWEWLWKQEKRYQEDGFGLWAMILKETGEMVGQCGLTMQDIGRSEPVLEIGYLLKKAHWRRGYATEAARGCREYAFQTLGAGEVFSIIRENNFPSQRVALRNGMTLRGQFIKHYYGMDMPHFIYSVAQNGQEM